jgi:hypothetical protein
MSYTMKKALSRAASIVLLAGFGLAASPAAMAAPPRPAVESIGGGLASDDRVHSVLKVGSPKGGSITLVLQGYSPTDRRFHATRVGARVFTISSTKSTYYGYFQNVSDGLAGTDFSKLRIAVKSWTVRYLSQTWKVSNTFNTPAPESSSAPPPAPDTEDDSTAAAAPGPPLTDPTGLISADLGSPDTGSGGGSSAAGDSAGAPAAQVNGADPSTAPAQAQAPRQAPAPDVAGPMRQPVAAKLGAVPGWATSGGWILLLLVPLVAMGAMFAALTRA